MLRLARFLKPFRKEVILGPIFKLIEAIFELIVPLVMAKVIDVGVATGTAAMCCAWAASCCFWA